MMLNPQLPFLTVMDENPDFDQGDINAEIQRLFERQKAIAQLVEGNLSPEILLDILSDQGLNASQFIDEVESNIDYLMGRYG